MSRKGGPRGTTPDERRLWRLVMKDVARLPGVTDDPPDLVDTPPPVIAPPVAAPAPSRPALPSRKATPAALTPGSVANIDRSTAGRFTGGAMPIEGRLDLHGMTQDKAHAALDRFIVDSAAKGRRCVLVITGKGSARGDDEPFWNEARGVLRRAVPMWLNGPALRPLVLSIAEATQRHGGSGALYVLLKRRRDG